ncbi:MAG: hypothetical protein JWM95_1131 [Gemmatimonadetes bacterium]|nr:hypothetical protein [Gemmatimonadota bacterium]
MKPTLLLALFIAIPLAAQEPVTDPRLVQPERPTVATHAHTVAPGYVEIESGIEGDRASAGKRSYFAPTVTKIGLTSHVQLNLSTPFVFSGPGQSSGVGDMSIGVKWRLVDDNPVLGDFALLPAVLFPTGSSSKGTGTDAYGASLTAIASYEVNGIAIDLNAAYAGMRSTGTIPSTQSALWTASFGAPVTGKLSWVLEFFGQPTIDGSGAVSTAAILTGPTYLVKPWLNLDVGIIAPFHGDMSNAIYAGMVWNVGSLFGRR